MASSSGGLKLPGDASGRPKPREEKVHAPVVTRRAWIILGIGAAVILGVVSITNYWAPPTTDQVSGTGTDNQKQIPETRRKPVAIPTTALIRVYFPEMDGSEGSRARLRALLPLLPKQQIEGRAGQPIVDVLRDSFRISAGDLDGTLAALASSARDSEGRPLEGTLPASGVAYVPATPLGAGGQFFRITTEGAAGAAGFGAFAQRPPTGERARSATYEVPLGQMETQSMARLLASGYARIASYPMELELSASPCPGPNEPPLDPGEQALAAQMSAAAGRSVDLFVVDMGWPDAPAQRASIARLDELINDVRGVFSLPRKPIALPSSFGEAHSHPQQIQQSLAPLQAADGAGRVRVTYVPLTTAQGAESVLRALLVHGELIRIRNRDGALATDGDAAKDEADAIRFVDHVYPRLPNGAEEKPFTDKDIVEALVRIAALGSEKADSRYFISHSWVIKNGLIPLGITGDARGVSVVAAGNAGVDVYADKIDLAQRSRVDKHFITVMNMDARKQRVCRTSWVAEDLIDDAGVVGFSGRLGVESATSFATPRVAWLMALAEAAQPVAHVRAEAWVPAVQRRLKALRSKDPSWAQLRVTPLQLLKMWN